MNQPTSQLKILLTLLILVIFLAGLVFFDELIEIFNQNKFTVFGGWLATIIGTFLAILLIVFQDNKDPQTRLAEQKAQKRKDLLCLLDSVEKVWITDVLENSLHQAVLLELGKESQPTQVIHPLEMQLELPLRENRLLPPTTTITQVFHQEAGRHLLILGEPGFGKTTTLLQLARDLLKKARRDDSLPIPVVFPLSSWAQKQLPLPEWMAQQLSAFYQIPKAIGEVWLREQLILPLFDGLDEMPDKHRLACALALNEFAEQTGLTGMAVTCRKQEYEALAAELKLQLNAAINLLPLRSAQIQTYLAAGGKALSGLKELLKEDLELAELAQSPLLLSIMSLAYHGVSLLAAKAEVQDSGNNRRDDLLERYIAKMFSRRKMEKTLYPKTQVLAGLSWLAKKMQQHGQTMFLLEYMQPNWLPGLQGFRFGSYRVLRT
jgi:predicted NACHT family NTPase